MTRKPAASGDVDKPVVGVKIQLMSENYKIDGSQILLRYLPALKLRETSSFGGQVVRDGELFKWSFLGPKKEK